MKIQHNEQSMMSNEYELILFIDYSSPYSYGDSAGIPAFVKTSVGRSPDFPFNRGDNYELNCIVTVKLRLCRLA